MRELAHILLHEPNSLAPAERELIATYVSSQNECYFCQTSHGAAAAAHLWRSPAPQNVASLADDTPVLAPGMGKTKTGRVWTYVRDDRPSGSKIPPAVWFAYSEDRSTRNGRTEPDLVCSPWCTATNLQVWDRRARQGT